MSKRKAGRRPSARRSNTANIILAVVVIGTLVIGGLAVSQVATRGSGSETTSRESETTFSVSAHVGQPASAFTAIGVDGQPYTVTPGDGRPMAIVFYMGFQ